jgi:hypothetical protein
VKRELSESCSPDKPSPRSGDPDLGPSPRSGDPDPGPLSRSADHGPSSSDPVDWTRLPPDQLRQVMDSPRLDFVCLACI